MTDHQGLPDFIGPYRVGALIIETDNARVYESFHPMRCSKLAIKAIKKQGVNLQAIEDECTLMLEIDHPNIMHAIDIYDLPNYKCVVMPLATGGDLFEYISANQRLEEVTACKVMFYALNALNYMHQLGIWHRDIKPENFLLMNDLKSDPSILLADLGYAKRFAPGETSQDWLGTPLYAAPEIYRKIPCMYFLLSHYYTKQTNISF